MRDIVETIQAEQDRVIRSGRRGVLVVDGGPGTGKTAVALHRAAYLLYTYREELSRRGVLIVGPNATFLRYVERVLPSLGENGVLLSTIGDLYPGLGARATEAPDVVEAKGRPEMAGVIAAAVRDRQEVPAEDRDVGDLGRLDRRSCLRAREIARRSRLPHNQARAVFAREIVAALAREVPGAALFEEADLVEVRRELAEDVDLQKAVDELWPILTPRQLVADLLTSRERLAAAAPGHADLLLRPPGAGWTPADVPLLDEAAELLGEDDGGARDRAEMVRRARVAEAQGILDILAGSAAHELDDPDTEVLMAYDLIDAEQLADRQGDPDGRTVAQRAAADRTWAFGHVIVDEAQELSAMAWRMLMRRCPGRSMTVVGDLAQRGDPAGASSWQDVLGPYVDGRWRLERLTVNYRTPAEIMEVAVEALPGVEPPRSVRATGVAPWREERADVAGVVARETARLGDGRLAVIAPASRLASLRHLLDTDRGVPSAEVAAIVERGGRPNDHTVPRSGVGRHAAAAAWRPAGDGAAGHGDLTRPVVVLTVKQAKGLEFDSVIVVDPDGIVAESPRGRHDLYVALTRATQRLGIVDVPAT